MGEGEPGATLRRRRSLPAAQRRVCGCDRRAEGCAARLLEPGLRVAVRGLSPHRLVGGYLLRFALNQLSPKASQRSCARSRGMLLGGARIRREVRLPSAARVRTKTKGRPPEGGCTWRASGGSR